MSFLNWLRRKKAQPIVNDSVVLTGNEIYNRLFEICDVKPKQLWFEDVKYVMPTRDELESTVLESKISTYEYIPEIEDCGDFALLLHAYTIRKRYADYKAGKIPKDQQYPWAFGQIWYIDSINGYHAVNICMTRDVGILLIEPQTGKTRKAEKNITVNFIRF